MPPVNEASTSEKALFLLDTDPPYSRHSTQLRQPRPHRNRHYGWSFAVRSTLDPKSSKGAVHSWLEPVH
jgi:hypothetical protein